MIASINSTLCFVESNTTGFGEYLINYCISNGYNSILATKDTSKYASLKSSITSGTLKTIIYTNIHDLSHSINNLDDVDQLILCSTSDAGISIILNAFKLIIRKNVIFRNQAVINIFRDKKLFRNHVHSFSPQVYTFSKETIDSICYPVIIKPIFGTGSKDINYIENRLELNNFCDNNQKLIPEYTCEQFISGAEYSLELLIINNKLFLSLGTFRKYLSPLPSRMEIAHLSDDSYYQKSIAEKIYKVLIKQLKFEAPLILHIEYKIDKDDQIYLIEVNPRPCGNLLPFCLMNDADEFCRLVIDLSLGNQLTNTYIEKVDSLIKNAIPRHIVCSRNQKEDNDILQYCLSNNISVYMHRKNPGYDQSSKDFRGRYSSFSLESESTGPIHEIINRFLNNDIDD